MKYHRVYHRLLVCLFCMLLSAVSAFSQTATLRGFVTDGSTGQALDLVNVVLLGRDGRTHGAASRIDGFYQIRGIPPGRYDLRATFIGFATYRDSLVLPAGEIHTVNITIEPAEEELSELVVEARAAATSAVPIAGLQTIHAAEIDRVPTPDISGDLAAYLTSMPGVVSGGDQGGQLFIRGGEPSQNMVLLDGILLYQPFHILGFYSAFPSDIISKVDVYAGGFGAKYGGRLSSVLDIRTREGNLYAYSGSGSISPFMGAIQVEGPVVPGRISVFASLRKSLLNELAGQYVNDDLPYQFSDAFGKVFVEVNKTSKLSFTYLKTSDLGTLADDTGGLIPEEVSWGNEAFGFRYVFLPRNIAAAVELRVSHSRLSNEIGLPGNPGRRSDIENTHVILEANFIGEKMDVNAGFDLRPIILSSTLGGIYQNIEFRNSKIGNWGNYLEMDIKAGSNFRILPSLRAQFYTVRFNPYLEPRLRLLWQIGSHRFSAATGIHHQEILGLTDRRDAANVFTAWTNAPRVNGQPQDNVLAGRIQRAVHGIAGYSLELDRRASISIEGFYKKLSNLYIAEWTSFPRFTTTLQPASGRSVGFDTRFGFQFN